MIWDDILPCGPLKQLIMVMFWFQAEIIYIEYISVECCWTKAIVFTAANMRTKVDTKRAYLNSKVKTSTLCEVQESMSRQVTVDEATFSVA